MGSSENFLSRLLGRGARTPANGSGRPLAAKTPAHPFRLGYVHSGAVGVLAVSPDAQTLALAGAGPVDREKRQFRRYKEHFDVVVDSDVVLLKDPAALAQADPPAGDGWRAISGHSGPVRGVAWEDETLWSWGADRRVRRVDLATGGALADHQLHHDAILHVLPLLPGSNADGGAVPSVGLGASVSADRTLKFWRRDSGKEVYKEFISSAIILSGLTLPHGGPDGAPIFLASDQHCEVLGRFGAEKPQKLEPLKFDEPVYRLAPASDGTIWAGHRLGAVSRLKVDPDAAKIVEVERREVFEGCRVLAMREFERDGQRWLACGSLRGEVALVPVGEGGGSSVKRLPQPLLARASALAWWKGRLLAGDHDGFLYDLTPWLKEGD
jgi:hypothetical protein